MSNLKFSGKVALVTGSGRGMGRTIALTLAQQGAALVINDVNQAAADDAVAEIVAQGGQAIAFVADVSNEAQVQAMVAAAMAQFGSIDILVNNAGILGKTRPVEDIAVADWDAVIGVNVRGVFNCIKAVLPIMKVKRYGKIVNVASLAGRSTSIFGGAHYTTSKAAVLGLSRHVAREVAPFNINVNATAPGSMDTDMVRDNNTPENIERARQNIPMRRLGVPQDHANLVAFLCSDEASYITGATVDINGGSLFM